MKVSIAMATYNGAQYLRAQLQSFLEQSHLPDELIITDDCSSDDTEMIVSDFARKAPFKVEFYRNEKRLGYCGNFNEALMKTTGDLVFLSDQDDEWFPEKLQHIINMANKHPDDWMLMNDAAFTDENLSPSGLTKIGQLESMGMGLGHYVMGCCSAIRRELLDLCMPIPENFHAHDTWLSWFASFFDRKFIDREVLQFYRRHCKNTSNILQNQSKKVSYISRHFSQLRHVLEQSSVGEYSLAIEQLRVFCCRLKGIGLTHPSVEIREQALYVANIVEQEINDREIRYNLRQMNFTVRTVRVMGYWLSGGYKNFNGLKSMVRDILG